LGVKPSSRHKEVQSQSSNQQSYTADSDPLEDIVGCIRGLQPGRTDMTDLAFCLGVN